ncbi:MAG: hypothetical protein LH609_13790 [Rudanella sp.]|nr:hypothetical protein [Rudanella sp.]
MFWMLLHADDAPGIWLYRRLRQQGVVVELVTVEEWFCNGAFTLTMDETTDETHLRLQDGRDWNLEQTRAVMARVCSMPAVAWQLFAESEKDYVAQEWQAIFMAWADLMPMLFNQPTPMGLSGRTRSTGEWGQLADSVGFDTGPFFYDSAVGIIAQPDLHHAQRVDLLVYRGRCYGCLGNLPEAVEEMACALQAASGEQLIGVSLAMSATGFVFIGASTHPDLRLGGDEFVEAILTDLYDGTALRSSERLAPAIAY